MESGNDRADARGGEREASGVDVLLSRVGRLARMPGAERRRAELVESAEREAGVPPALSEDAYDIAVEEGLPPALALELIRAGVGVCEKVGEEPYAPAISDETPEWVTPPPPTAEAQREWRLRTTFRRLGTLLEECGDMEEAVRAFVAEPDVGECSF